MKPGTSERIQAVAIWLLPSAEGASRFQQVINTLADQQGAPRFEPHVTLGSIVGSVPDLRELQTILADLRLAPTEVSMSDSFTRSLFVRFAPSLQLCEARMWLAQQPGFRSSRSFDPHISLCYGPPTERQASVATVQALRESPVLFDRMSCMQIALPVETHADIAQWRRLQVLYLPTND